MSHSHGSGSTYSRQPIHLQKTREQRRSQGSCDMVVAFCPVKTSRSELPPQCIQLVDVNVESAQNLRALRGQEEYVRLYTNDLLVQKLISQRNGEHAGEVVITRARKAYFGDGRIAWISGERSQSLDRGCNVSIPQPEESLPPLSFAGNQSTAKKLREMRTGGLGRNVGRDRQLGC